MTPPSPIAVACGAVSARGGDLTLNALEYPNYIILNHDEMSATKNSCTRVADNVYCSIVDGCCLPRLCANSMLAHSCNSRCRRRSSSACDRLHTACIEPAATDAGGRKSGRRSVATTPSTACQYSATRSTRVHQQQNSSVDASMNLPTDESSN